MHSCSNGVLSGSKVVSSLLGTMCQPLFLERSEASAVASCSLLSQVLWCVLVLLVSFMSCSSSLLSQDGKDFSDTLSEDSNLGEVNLRLR